MREDGAGRIDLLPGDVNLHRREGAVGDAIQFGDGFGYNVDGDALGLKPALDEHRFQFVRCFA